MNLKYQLQHGMKNLNYLIDHVLYQRYSGYFEYILKKKHRKKSVNPLIKKYINKIENRITFKIKTRYCLEILTETMELLESTKSKIPKNKNGENMPHLETTEVV